MQIDQPVDSGEFGQFLCVSKFEKRSKESV